MVSMSADTEVREKEASGIRTVSVFIEETEFKPWMKQFIEDTIDKKIREAFLKMIRNEVMSCIDARVAAQRIPSKTERKYYLQISYDFWMGLLAFLTFISGYFTLGQIIPLVPGILLMSACVITLLLFIIPKVLRLL